MNNWFSQQPKEQRIVSSSLAESSRSVHKRINGTYEDRISAPSGREVATPFRQAYMGRGGAGNGIAEHSRGFRHRAAKQYWVEDQEVLKKYKETHGPDHITGRGGAGAKGHVNIKGWIPNQERALAKEKEVMKKWQEKKKVNGGIKMGRGGSGNILKNDRFTSPKRDSVSLVDIDSDWEPQVEVLEAVITSSDLRQRRNEFAYVHRSSSSTSFRRRPNLLINTRPRTADTTSSYDAHSSTRTFSSAMDSSSTFPTTHSGSEVSVRTTTIVTNIPIIPRVISPTRIPNEAAPFEEPGELLPEFIEPTRPPHTDLTPKRTKQRKFGFLNFKSLTKSKSNTDPVPFEIPLVYDADPSTTSHPTYEAWSHEMPIAPGKLYRLPSPIEIRDDTTTTSTHTPHHHHHHQKRLNTDRHNESIGTGAPAILTPSTTTLSSTSHQIVQSPVPSLPPLTDIQPSSGTPLSKRRPLPQPPVLPSQHRQNTINNLPSPPTQPPKLALLETA